AIATATFLAEVAPSWLREILKPTVELLAAVPSVVIGFVGLAVVSPALKEIFHLRTGLTAATGSVALAIMAIPTIVTIAEDALAAVPRSYRDASLALGANSWQTTWHVVLPAAAPGLLAAVILGAGRVMGETMAVLMVTGNAANLTLDPREPVRTMTATIAAEMGETAQGSDHYHALFALGAVLYGVTLVINAIAAFVLERARGRMAGAR
ncbi:MAG: phosphate ABC transporter permease subunit PstC, partial [Planctomycetota bacterium]